MTKLKKNLLLVAVIVSLSSTAFAEDANRAIIKGNQFVQRKDYKKAIREYEAAVKIDPKSSNGHLLLALTYAKVGNFDKSIEHSQIAIQLGPSFSAYHNLGLIYANKGDYEKGLEAYHKALNYNPESYRAWYQLGLLQATHGKFKEAIDNYNKSLSLNSQLSNTYLGLASAYYWSGDKRSAGEQVDALISIGDKDKAMMLKKWLAEKESKSAEAQTQEAETLVPPPATAQ